MYLFREGVLAAWRWRNNTMHQGTDKESSISALAQQIERRVRELERLIEIERAKEGIG